MTKVATYGERLRAYKVMAYAISQESRSGLITPTQAQAKLREAMVDSGLAEKPEGSQRFKGRGSRDG